MSRERGGHGGSKLEKKINRMIRRRQSMAMKYRQHFTVEGSGQFPIDMLRYDCCWLTDEIWDPDTLLGYDQPKRQVKITRYVETKDAQPSARWPSRGGWRVITDSIRTERLP